jgi:thiol-disulfide isomerase/thioredoxin/outer membrane lipoprotein-sorting protein
MFSLILVSFIQSLLFVQTSSGTPTSPANILRGMLKAVEGIDSVEYEVRREYKTSEGEKFRGRTTILASRSPFRFSARLQAEDATITQIAISDGRITRGSSDGKTNEISTFASRYPKEKVMPYVNDANLDVSATWRLLLDADFVKEIIVSGNILYVKQDDIEGDLCHVVLSVRDSAVFESVTEYYWISVKTGLPRAMQRLALTRGSTNLNPRFIISKIKINPVIPADAFTYKPTATDSSTVRALKTTTADSQPPERSLVGSQLPAVEVRDLEFKPLKLSDYSGKPTIISFWATWCGPCMAEFPMLQKIRDDYKGELQVLAVAVQDSRLNVLKFIKENPRYKFVFVTDPDIQESESRLAAAFGVSNLPKSIFVDAQGKIVDQWTGFKETEQQLLEVRVRRLMGR